MGSLSPLRHIQQPASNSLSTLWFQKQLVKITPPEYFFQGQGEMAYALRTAQLPPRGGAVRRRTEHRKKKVCGKWKTFVVAHQLSIYHYYNGIG